MAAKQHDAIVVADAVAAITTVTSDDRGISLILVAEIGFPARTTISADAGDCIGKGTTTDQVSVIQADARIATIAGGE